MQLFTFEHALRNQWSSESPATPEDLCDYENAWKECLQNKFLGATEHEMMRVIAHSPCVIVSDFHPLKRSRQDFSTVVSNMDDKQNVLVVLELLKSGTSIVKGQSVCENVVLENGMCLIDSYPLLFDEQHCTKYEIVGVCTDGNAYERDAHCARVIDSIHQEHPHKRIALHFGDWHLADNHLPRLLKDIGLEVTAIHLSPQPLWDRLIKRDFDEVLQFGPNKWAWMRTPPLAHAAAFLLDFTVFNEDDYAEELAYLIEMAADNLATSMNLELPQSAFEVMCGDDWHSFWSSLDKHHQQQYTHEPRTVVFHPRLPLMWIPAEVDANMIIQAAAHLIYCEHFMTEGGFCDSFRAATLRHLCNITLNPFFKLRGKGPLCEQQWVERSAFEHARLLKSQHRGLAAHLFDSFKHPQLWDYELQLLRDTIEVA